MGYSYYTWIVVALLCCSLFRGAILQEIDGTKYVFGIPMTDVGGETPYVAVSTLSTDDVDISLTIPGLSFEHPATISKDASVNIALPKSALIFDNDGINDKTIIVTASEPVNVQGLDQDGYYPEAFLALPINMLGTDYYVLIYPPIYRSSHATICSLDQVTTVDIVTPAGQQEQQTLPPYHCYRFNGAATLESADPATKEDLTGTHITSDHPISVVTGVVARVNNDNTGSASTLLSQLPPVSLWGTTHILAPLMSISCGYYYRVQAQNQVTELQISNEGTVTIQPGESIQREVFGDTVVTLTSDVPVLVGQIMKERFYCDSMGDASLMSITPVEDYHSDAIFHVFDMTSWITTHNYINIITDCDNIAGLSFDGTPIADWNQLTTDDQSMCILRGEVLKGFHSVTSTNPSARFFVYIYMICPDCNSSHLYRATIPLHEAGATESVGTCTVCEYMELICEGTSMMAIFNTSVLDYTNPSDVHLLDPDCTASALGDGASVSTGYNQCGTTVEETADCINYKNSLILAQDGDSAISATEVNIQCCLENHHTVDMSFTTSLNTKESTGSFLFQMDVYTGPDFTEKYLAADYPISVKVGDPIYAGASVDTVNGLVLFLENCWATPTADALDATNFYLIEDGCPIDSVEEYDLGDPSSVYISYPAFTFKDSSSDVYLHCQMVVCHPDTIDSRCAQGCITSKRR